MTTIEELAKTMFEHYAYRETGTKLRWKHISKERQEAWMDEAMFIVRYMMEHLKTKVKPINDLSPTNTSYAMGYNEGVKSERLKFIDLLIELHKDLLEQYTEFKSK